MQKFELEQSNLVRLVGGLIAEELDQKFRKHIDQFTQSEWTSETVLGVGGVNLSQAQREAITTRIKGFVGEETLFDGDDKLADLGDVAKCIEKLFEKGVETLSFMPASRSDDAPFSHHLACHVYSDASAIANLLHGRRRLISLVAPHSALGFVLTLLTPAIQKIESVDARGLSPTELKQLLKFGDVLVATPTLWRYMMRENLEAPDNVMGVSFGEPWTTELSDQMRKAGFGAMRELYGSTETGVIGWRNTPHEEFMLFDHWQRVDDGLVRMGSTQGSAVEPMDVLEWRGERRFGLSGRKDGVVQIGAVNVNPAMIEEKICEHRYVEQCDARVETGVQGVRWLVVYITLKKGVSPNEISAKSIDRWCKEQLTLQARPRIFHFVK